MQGVRAVCACAVLALTAVFAAPAAADPLGFFPAQYIDDTYAGGEPVIQVDTVHHTVVVSSHEGTTHIYRPGLPSAATLNFFTEYRNQTKMWVSKDGGVTFKRIDFNGSGFATDPSKNSGFSDPDFAIDEGGRIYNTGINLASDAVFSSGDGGETWDKGNPECHPGDRPWLAAGKPDELWMATNTLVESPSHQIFTSTDGGNTCSATGIPSGNGNGKLYFDHVSQQLFEPIQDSNKIGIATWKRGESQFTDHFAPTETGGIYAHWPAVAQDGAGTIYAVWDDDPTVEGAQGCGGAQPAPNHINLIYTKDYGQTWSAPVRIAAPASKRVFWPWIAAGDAGKLSVVWYETDKVVDLSCEPAQINIKAAAVLNADNDAKRTIEEVDAAGRPISVTDQALCQSGTTCVATGEDRRLGDFFTNAIDERGCMVIASGDTMSEDPVTGGTRPTSLPLFIRQKSGPRLIGSGDCSGNPQPQANVPQVSPPSAKPKLPSSRKCLSRRLFTIHLRAPKGQRLRTAKVWVAGKPVKVRRKKGRLTAVVDLRKLHKARFVVKIDAVTAQGRHVKSARRYHTCKPKKRK